MRLEPDLPTVHYSPSFRLRRRAAWPVACVVGWGRPAAEPGSSLHADDPRGDPPGLRTVRHTSSGERPRRGWPPSAFRRRAAVVAGPVPKTRWLAEHADAPNALAAGSPWCAVGPAAEPGMLESDRNSVQPISRPAGRASSPAWTRPANGRIRIAGRRRASAARACWPSCIYSRAATKRTRSGGLPAAPVFPPATARSKLAAAVEEPGFLGHVG